MEVNQKIKDGIQNSILIEAYVRMNGMPPNWASFTRTQFNQISFLINKKVTERVIENSDILESGLIIGISKLEELLRKQGFKSSQDFIHYLSSKSHYRPICWISGKTLHSYWQGTKAKNMKLHVLLLFLDVDFKHWEEWLLDDKQGTLHPKSIAEPPIFPKEPKEYFPQNSGLKIIRNYYQGQYYLYYQKCDNSKNIIKTPFTIRENDSGKIIVRSISEGHRYLGEVIGIRDGCVYINCQNLDFEEVEQYIFNIGLETKPEILFGVSNTVSVKSRMAVALKNILVKQKIEKEHFEKESEIEIHYSKTYADETEESLIVQYLKQSTNNIILTANCCSLEDLRDLKNPSR